MLRFRVYFVDDDDDDSVDTVCPDCESPATYDDDGVNCSNPDCKNSRIG
jgi:hypothetical protein